MGELPRGPAHRQRGNADPAVFRGTARRLRLRAWPQVRPKWVYAVAMNVGILVKKTRLAAGLDQAELARRAATTQTYVSRVERGVTVPSLPTLERLFGAMGRQVRLLVEKVPTGNVESAELRREFLASTAEQRIDEAFALSTFLTGLAAESGDDG
jgi:transcriptional regulator with XRE-family HTH domain